MVTVGDTVETSRGSDGPMRSLPDSAKSTSGVRSYQGDHAGHQGPGGFPHVLRGRDVRDSLWETCWTLPRSGRIEARQV